MTRVQAYKAEDHPWDWLIPVSFQQGWRVGDLLFVGSQVSMNRQCEVIGSGDIVIQTRNTFEAIKKVVEDTGGRMSDLVKLNTDYVCDGPDGEALGFWEAMTRVRMEYMSDPAQRPPRLEWPAWRIRAC